MASSRSNTIYSSVIGMGENMKYAVILVNEFIRNLIF